MGFKIRANDCRQRQIPQSSTFGDWHFDEVFARMAGKRMYLWRAVDHEGEVLEVLAQSRRNKRAARKLGQVQTYAETPEKAGVHSG